ncbi:MAG: hypothetical protein GVY29_04465 [Spirochaetes bacterium]|nr:hypothetical protein [Spirochaetota bacterium]
MEDSSVYLIAWGSVEVRDPVGQPGRIVTVIEEGHHFGERSSLFEALEPALHPLAGEHDIHIRALTDEVPGSFGDPDQLFTRVSSSARRRDVWEMLPGKNMVLLRNGSSDLIDSGIGTVSEARRDLIVNIDYAFGELELPGEGWGAFQPVPDPETADIDALQTALPENDIHLGPLLTVEGTLLQNRLMLHFYRRIWGCTGIEMEGIHYYRQVLESAEVRMRFFYYVSDTPLSAFEGIPPLYAITRTILRRILQPTAQTASD